ncbi:MAG: hypothetical protein KC464_33885, partial [Myxococcales bacterium]|nr:hypothetical protein [Myxococcales bacterium]
EETGMPVLAALARRRAGEILGGAEGARRTDEADAVLKAHGVAAPARFARVFATWPSDRG